MAATRTRTRASANGTAVATKAKGAGETVASAARRAPAHALTAGAAAVAGLAGGLVIGSRRERSRVPARVARAMVGGARRVAVVAGAATSAADDIHAIRRQLEIGNRRSPIEVVIDGLTHRSKSHRRVS